MGFRIAIAQYEGGTSLRVPPLAAGLLASTIRRTPDLSEVEIGVHARRVAVELAAAALEDTDLLGISLYTWNARYALAVARSVKARRPAIRIVAGGPSVPRRELEPVRFLEAHPWIDALVLGEGERAFVDVVRAVRAGERLGSIAGVVAREADTIAIGPPRTRLQGDAFAEIGSPYLDGTFDELVARGELASISAVVLETNRGCPFSCTFCDWGQATHSRVHELPSDRIERELAWIGERGIPYLYLVDANFGIRRRDVEITREIGRVCRARGAPRFVFFHLTKNATEQNLRTVEILREHGVGSQVALSMQDFDDEVLLAIRRDNIRPTHALALRERCHAKGLTTVNELMLGLPAQTAASVRRSLAAAITPFPGDSFFLYPTRVLDNAELADPAYRARYGLVTRRVPQWPLDPAEELYVVEDEELVVATASLPIDAWREGYAFGYVLASLWNHRILQTTLHVLRYVAGVDLIVYIDALLASEQPRLRAIRDELDRFSRAIVDGEASTLPIAGWGVRRREPGDAVCAHVFDDPAGFYAEAADAAARLAKPSDQAMIRDVVRWDAAHLSIAGDTARVLRFEHDWLDYEAAMAMTPRPAHRPIAVCTSPPPPVVHDPSARPVALELFKTMRVALERLDATPPARALIAAPREAAVLHRRAREDGFVYLPALLPKERLAPLRDLVDAILAGRGWLVDGRSDPALRLGRWDDARWLEVLAEVTVSDAYRSLAAALELVGPLRDILGAEPQLDVGDVCRLVSPGAIDLTTPPHQDAAYLTDAADVWTAWIPLGPCPASLGPLAMLAGSHHAGLLPHVASTRDHGVVTTTIAGDVPWCSQDLEAGDVIMFSALTVHCALPNVTADQLRVSVNYRYRPRRELAR